MTEFNWEGLEGWNDKLIDDNAPKEECDCKDRYIEIYLWPEIAFGRILNEDHQCPFNE